jgi:hypothetical protein
MLFKDAGLGCLTVPTGHQQHYQQHEKREKHVVQALDFHFASLEFF